MNHKDLEVWKKSIGLTKIIYELTETFPKEELYGLVNQMRRSAVSVPSNIAEGCGRFSDKDTIKFLNISLGSLSELETQLIIAKELGYYDCSDDAILEKEIPDQRKLLIGMIKYLQNKQTK